jgi:hypothetical protein
MSKEFFVIKPHFYIYIIIVLTIASCSNNSEQPKKQTSRANDTTGKLSTSEFKSIPILSRELVQENDTFYADEDCFCSSRVLVFDTVKRQLNVFSWCQHKDSPEKGPDFGAYAFEKILPDSSIQFSGTGSVPTEFPCIQIKSLGHDSLMTLRDCSSQKMYFFTSMRLLNNYEIRDHDCDDVQG